MHEPKAQSYCLIKIKRSLLGEENNLVKLPRPIKFRTFKKRYTGSRDIDFTDILE